MKPFGHSEDRKNLRSEEVENGGDDFTQGDGFGPLGEVICDR